MRVIASNISSIANRFRWQQQLRIMILGCIVVGIFLVQPSLAFADSCPKVFTAPCTMVDQCVRGMDGGQGQTCVAAEDRESGSCITHVYPSASVPCGGGAGQAVFGGIAPPGGRTYVDYNYSGSKFTIGILSFFSRLLRLFTFIIGGVFLLQIVYAGFLYLSSQGDSAVFNKFKETLYWSLIGLFVLAVSYAIAAIIGILMFGNATFLTDPQLYSAIP